MKYKLIDLKTKEENLCDKVTIDGFEYYFSNQLPKVGDTVYNCKSKEIYKIRIKEEVVNYEFPIICCNNPNIDIPKVVDEVKKSVKLSYEATKNQNFANGKHEEAVAQIYFRRGYNKSQETHPFSEEDMIEFLEWAEKEHWWKSTDARFPLTVGLWTKTVNGDFKYKDGKLTKELLQLWKEQKINTLYYE